MTRVGDIYSYTAQVVGGEENNVGNKAYVLPHTGTLFGSVYNDSNKNGTKDDRETAPEGIIITMTDSKGPRSITSPNGKYQFDDVAPGEVTIEITELPEDIVMNDGNKTKFTVTAIVDKDVNAGDIGYIEETLVKVFGVIYEDKDFTGKREEGEIGAADINVTITDEDGTVKMTRTDDQGNYTFTDIEGGNLKLTVTNLPADAEFSATNSSEIEFKTEDKEEYQMQDIGYNVNNP